MTQPLDLAPVGNGIVAGLFDRLGRCSWLCWPRFDGDPIFCSLLGGVEPQDGFMECEVIGLRSSRQTYRRNTAILETELEDERGARLRITDVAPRFTRFGRSFRPPMLVRRIEPLSGSPLIRLRIRPKANWGSEAPVRRAGSNHMRYFTDTSALRVTTDAPLACLAEEAPFLLDQPVSIIIGPDETVPENTDSLVQDFIRETDTYWLDWSRGLHLPFEWQEAVIRAAITLKLCTFEETGAIVAALTTSIPEAADTQRNWDYRYCWLRDSLFTVQALNRLGATRTMEDYIRYVTNVVAISPGGVLKPCYPLVPSLPMPERIAGSLPGFLGMGPVRVGNQAAEQVQNDVYGSVIMAAAQMFFDQRLPRPAGEPLFRLLETLGEQAEQRALQPDAGIWEYRGRERTHTFSAAMCWAGLARLSGIARHLGLKTEADRWATSARTLHATICDRAFRPALNSFVESFESDGMDASLLLLPEIGFLSATDPRFIGTLDRVGEKLLHEGFIYRYDMSDDFGKPETAFLVCSFWYVDALAAAGRTEEARTMFGSILSCRNHLGLLAEDLDPNRNQLWGNFPQTYSHVGLILSAMRLSRSWEHGLWGG
ncbi:MAG: glycoside hydrolase 15-related protein [Roseomonas sp.]|nr:glycoside hydrolase 15-related protein [Roseomonas sp.]